MKSKILENKKKKMAKLYDSAYELFTAKGVHATVIDEIVKRAGVAKGTFYLYCKDKYDLVDKVIVRKSSLVLDRALKALAEKKQTESLDFQQSVVFFVDYLVQVFREDSRFLELIAKNLSLGLFQELFHCKEMESTREAFVRNFMLNGGTSDAAGKRLYLIVCMVGVVCYSSFVLEIPYRFDEIKPELYRSVEKILA